MWPVFINSILLLYKQRMIFLPFSVLPWYKLSSELSVKYQVTNPLNVFVSQLSIQLSLVFDVSWFCLLFFFCPAGRRRAKQQKVQTKSQVSVNLYILWGLQTFSGTCVHQRLAWEKTAVAIRNNAAHINMIKLCKNKQQQNPAISASLLGDECNKRET